jgi:hypothetical protein
MEELDPVELAERYAWKDYWEKRKANFWKRPIYTRVEGSFQIAEKYNKRATDDDRLKWKKEKEKEIKAYYKMILRGKRLMEKQSENL